MGEELHGLANGMKAIGEFHATNNGAALEPLAKVADKAVEDIREELEKLTGWEHK